MRYCLSGDFEKPVTLRVAEVKLRQKVPHLQLCHPVHVLWCVRAKTQTTRSREDKQFCSALRAGKEAFFEINGYIMVFS